MLMSDQGAESISTLLQQLMPTVTPYKDRTELLSVRELFYRDQENLESLRKGVSIVNFWRTRGHLPHGVDATAWIISAFLQDRVGAKSIKSSTQTGKSEEDATFSAAEELVLRNAYSMALVRFVNGILDPFQQGAYAMALSVLAKNIGLPYAFVEVRHWATHESLPSLESLRFMCRWALEWIHDNFWIGLDSTEQSTSRPSASQPSEPSDADVRRQIVSLVRSYKGIQRRQGAQEAVATQAEEIVSQLSAIAQDRKQCIEMARLFVSNKVLLKSQQFSGLRTMYNDLLQAFPASFNLRLIYSLISQCCQQKQTPSAEHSLISSWLETLIPLVLRGPFPFEMHHSYRNADEVKVAIKNYAVASDATSDIVNVVNKVLSGGEKKKKFASVPSLSEILNVPSERATSSCGSPDFQEMEAQASKKQKVNGGFMFSRHQGWTALPFGATPEPWHSQTKK